MLRNTQTVGLTSLTETEDPLRRPLGLRRIEVLTPVVVLLWLWRWSEFRSKS